MFSLGKSLLSILAISMIATAVPTAEPVNKLDLDLKARENVACVGGNYYSCVSAKEIICDETCDDDNQLARQECVQRCNLSADSLCQSYCDETS